MNRFHRLAHVFHWKVVASLVLATTIAITLAGCSGIEKAPPQSTSTRAETGFTMNVPEIMRGTVGAETLIRGYQAETSPGYRPIVASGYGLVVGLKGTGAKNIPAPLRAYMLTEAARGGFGNERFGPDVAAMTPEQLLDSPDTAVVVVEGIVPQGAPEGTLFDVRVFADPSTGTTSIEGGTLYTTMLRPGQPSMGGKQAAELAKAAGPVFVNPFAEPGAIGEDSIVRTAGRVLNGGVIVKDMPLKLQLASPSHARASVLQGAINTRFPQEPGQRQNTARGESDELIEITVPPSWHDRTEEFVKLLMHTTITQANPEAVAMYVRRTLLANPAPNADPAALRWQALGTAVLPMIKDLYDYPEELPRIAALRAGARLDDGLAIPFLITLASEGSTVTRVQAIELLEHMRSNPRIDAALRELLDDDDVEIRLRAYEALVMRGDPFMGRHNVDNKFILDVVRSSRPLIYVTQMREPRIAVFGNDLELERPITISTWSNRLMVKGDQDEKEVEVYYRIEGQDRGVILHVKPDMPDFVQFLGHKTSIEEPEAGLNLTYGETVGALYQIWRQQRIDADFKLQQDRILAAIRRIQTESEDDGVERPELSKADREDFGTQTSDLGRLGDAPAVSVPTNKVESLPGTTNSSGGKPPKTGG